MKYQQLTVLRDTLEQVVATKVRLGGLVSIKWRARLVIHLEAKIESLERRELYFLDLMRLSISIMVQNLGQELKFDRSAFKRRLGLITGPLELNGKVPLHSVVSLYLYVG